MIGARFTYHSSHLLPHLRHHPHLLLHHLDVAKNPSPLSTLGDPLPPLRHPPRMSPTRLLLLNQQPSSTHLLTRHPPLLHLLTSLPLPDQPSSSSSAEFRAVASVTTETLWLRNLLTDLHITVTKPPAYFCDNISATLYAKNPVFHSRMKHMALSFHFVKEQLQHGQVRIQHVNNKDQLADILTKPLHKTHYLELRNKIGLTSRTSILRGRINCISPNKANINTKDKE